MPKTPFIETETYMLAGDVGGTNTRLGLFRPEDSYPVFDDIRIFSSAAYPDLESVVEEYLKTRQVRISGACFGIAGPVDKGKCRTTNLPWEVSESDLRNAFSWPHIRLVNDLAALGAATHFLKKEELFILQEGKRGKEGHRGLVAPGTGLGMSLMIKVHDGYIPLHSEGGHMDFAPNREEEAELWRYIHQAIGHVSVERIISGPGLVNIYRWLIAKNETEIPNWLAEKMRAEDPARVISEAALSKDDPLCCQALEIFVSVLGAVAGNVALIGLTYGGIYLGGGIVPKILPVLKKENFLRSFSDKGRFRDLLESIPVYAILNDQAALIGAAVYLYKERL
jgi:glucokinase